MLKFVHDLIAEQPSSPSRVLLPGFYVFLGVRPHKIADGPGRRDFNVSFKRSDGVDGSSFGREASMNTEYLSLDDGSEGKVVKGIIEIIPDVVVPVFFGDFVIKSIDVGNVTGLVVAPQQDHCLGIF